MIPNQTWTVRFYLSFLLLSSSSLFYFLCTFRSICAPERSHRIQWLIQSSCGFLASFNGNHVLTESTESYKKWSHLHGSLQKGNLFFAQSVLPYPPFNHNFFFRYFQKGGNFGQKFAESKAITPPNK